MIKKDRKTKFPVTNYSDIENMWYKYYFEVFLN